MVHLPVHNMRWMQPMWSHLQTLLGYDTTVRDIQPTREPSQQQEMTIAPPTPHKLT